jgi:DNA-binding MarR family transcriptional regulator
MKANERHELLADCACFDLRTAARDISRMYDDFLRDEGLNITQYALLSRIRTEKEVSISTLGRHTVMDRTSITRALTPLERDGLIHSRSGADKRIRIVSVTDKGHKLIKDAEPKWREAQEALVQIIGEHRWRAMRALLRDTTRLVRHPTITAHEPSMRERTASASRLDRSSTRAKRTTR